MEQLYISKSRRQVWLILAANDSVKGTKSRGKPLEPPPCVVKKAKQAVTTQSQAERLQNYHSKLQGLVAAISESNNFYSALYDQAQEGAESAAAVEATIQPCNEVYALVQVKLGEAQKLAKESAIRVYLLQQQVVLKTP
ncbi:hypothetical protein ARSEF4850_007736 [Beauveria asiatica]